MKTGLVPRDEHEPGVRGEDRLQQRQDPELQTRRLYQEIQVMNGLDLYSDLQLHNSSVVSRSQEGNNL